jgi:hypothetical protein
MNLASVPLYALPVSTIIIGLSIGLIKFSEYIQNCYVSNTNLIIRQNDQIGFLLKRLVELNNKIAKLELDFTTLSTKQYFTYDDDELEADELEADELETSKLVDDELEAKNLIKDELVVKEEVFEIIDATLTTITSKKTGWFSF